MDKFNPNIEGEKEAQMADQIGADIAALFKPITDAISTGAGAVGWIAENWKLAVIGVVALLVLLRD